MSEKASLLSIYKLLPQTNCGECGEANCMAYASKLLERQKNPEDCKPMFKGTKYKKNLIKLIELVSPPIREILIGIGETTVKIGGKEVLYRHQLTFHNPTVIAIDVSDTMNAEEIRSRCIFTEKFSIIKMGEELKLNMIAIRSASGDPERFASCAKLVSEICRLPLILCSLDSNVLKAALEIESVSVQRPLLYAANKDNWMELGELAKRYNCPIVASSHNNLDMLISIVSTLESMGIRDIVLDPGALLEGGQIKDTINNLVMLRRAGLNKVKSTRYPLLCIPAAVWAIENNDKALTSYRESIIASLLINKFADIIIMHTLDMWALLPVITLKYGIYTDPRKPVSVDAGLTQFGIVDEKSPVLLTTNFALTYYTVANDIEASKLNCFLITADTGGLAVEVGVAGGQLTAAGINEIMKSSDVTSKVKHKRIVIPGRAARLKGEIEDVTGWEVMIGPQDSSEIKTFLTKHWEEK